MALRGKLVGVEALLRWNDPLTGAIPPALFIPIAEEAGMMPELGEWIMRTAMKSAALWPEVEMSINLSPAQFRHVDLEGLLKSLLEESAVEPSRITLEITETEPVVKGQTASSSYKPALLSNGVKTQVPPHISAGTRIVVMTEDGSYVGLYTAVLSRGS